MVQQCATRILAGCLGRRAVLDLSDVVDTVLVVNVQVEAESVEVGPELELTQTRSKHGVHVFVDIIRHRLRHRLFCSSVGGL